MRPATSQAEVADTVATDVGAEVPDSAREVPGSARPEWADRDEDADRAAHAVAAAATSAPQS